MPNMSGEVLGLMLTGIILAVALVVMQQIQGLGVVCTQDATTNCSSAGPYAYNASSQVLSGLYTFAQFFAVIILIVVIGVIVVYLNFKKN